MGNYQENNIIFIEKKFSSPFAVFVDSFGKNSRRSETVFVLGLARAGISKREHSTLLVKPGRTLNRSVCFPSGGHSLCWNGRRKFK